MRHFLHSIFAPGSVSDDPNDVRTTFLVVEPSYLSGMGRIIDLWGGFDQYAFSSSNEEADLRAIYADWRLIGQDVRDVCRREAVRQQLELELQP
jgi:hypothetical protein